MASRAMHYVLISLLALTASACLGPNGPGAAPPPTVQAERNAELIVGYAPGVTEAEQASLRQAHGVEHVLPLRANTEVWQLTSAEAPIVAAALQRDARIRFAEPNQARRLTNFGGLGDMSPVPSPVPTPVPPLPPASANPSAPALPQPAVMPVSASDPDLDKQWYLSQSGFDDVWSQTTGEGVKVAVIDSGVDPEHPDLKDNLLPLIDEVAARGKADDYNGFSYAGRDGNGHGTHVAGLIAAVARNGVGIRGAASGVKLLPIKVTTASGETDDVTLAKGIFDAVDGGAQVINLSIGGPDPSLVLLEALNYAFSKNVTVVIAAGNESRGVNYPAAFDGVVAVGALTSNNTVASYSNHGPKLVLCAPGGGRAGGYEGSAIYSTTPTYGCYITLKEGNTAQYGFLSGTSMATPLVTAAVALILSKEPGLAPAQLRTRLAATADDMGTPGFDEQSGFGSLDVGRALDYGRRP